MFFFFQSLLQLGSLKILCKKLFLDNEITFKVALLFLNLLNHREDSMKNFSRKVKGLVAQLCLTLCDPMGCSSPGTSVPGILQARILEWVAIPFSRRVFLTQESKPGSPASQADSLALSHSLST